MEQSSTDPRKSWAVLLALLVVGVLAVLIGLPRNLALPIIYSAAVVEVYIIGRSYMRLRSEDLLIYFLALLPLVLVIALAIVLVPDIGTHR